jgi:rhodanese-related sulfurtransferase/DNA-directed RNA polymerase subunit RPC12/RpoP
MKVLHVNIFCLTAISAIMLFGCTPPQRHAGIASAEGEYACIPCGNDCDDVSYAEGGECPHCHMPLVKSATINFKTIQPGEICGYIKTHPAVVLLDVRTKDEFDGKADPDFGTLKNAINIPVQELEGRLSEISSMKDKEVIVYCSHSHRSPRASYLLTQNGFTNVANMAGGMSVLIGDDCKR